MVNSVLSWSIHIMMTCLEDEIIQATFGDRLVALCHYLTPSGGRFAGRLFGPAVRYAQRAAESRNSSTRRALVRYDDSNEDMLAFAGRSE